MYLEVLKFTIPRTPSDKLRKFRYFGTRLIFYGRVETAITPRTPRPSATRVANKKKGNRPLDLHAVNQLPELDAPPRHNDLDVRDRVVSVERGVITTILPNSRRRARTRGSSLKGGLVTTHSPRSCAKKSRSSWMTSKPSSADSFPQGELALTSSHAENGVI